jgi:hypothetical protein
MFRVFLEACAQSRRKIGHVMHRGHIEMHISASIVRILGVIFRRLLCCPAATEGGRVDRGQGRTSQRYPCRVLPSSCLVLTNQNQSASHSLVRRGQSLGHDSGADTAKKALADLSCDRCLMQLARVASHQTPGAVDEPIGDGFEVTGLLLQVPHLLPCHE